MLLRTTQHGIAALALLCAACAQGDIEPDGGPFGADTDASEPPTADARPAPDADRAAPDASPVPADASPVADASPADAAPAPDAGCTPIWMDLLDDGSFDSGGAAWTTVGGTIVRTSASMPISAHTPDYAAWLVGANNADEQLYQAVDVPADASSLRLIGHACYVTEDTTGTDDALTYSLRTTAGATLETLASYSNADVPEVCSWTPFVLYATDAHAGQTVQLHLHGVSDGSYYTSFFVDSLRLEALACP